jgi:hypothetical protein
VTNLTAEYWDVDGVSLDTYAFNIQTLGGSRSGVPSFRGTNTQSAAKRGTAWRPKVADARTLTLAMNVLGVDASTPGGSPSKSQFRANFRSLQRLLWRPGGTQYALTKRWDEGAGIVTASALAEFVSGLEPTMSGDKMAKTTVDLKLNDPFFYSTLQTSTIGLATPTTITNAGDDVAVKMTIEFNGPLTNPKLTNSTPVPQVYVKYGGTVASGDKVILDVDVTTALVNSTGASVIGAITHSGARHWLGFARGSNTLTLTADAGSGTVTMKYYIPYF